MAQTNTNEEKPQILLGDTDQAELRMILEAVKVKLEWDLKPFVERHPEWAVSFEPQLHITWRETEPVA